MFSTGDDLIGFELTEDSISFVFDEDKIINFIDLEGTNFFETPQAPHFQETKKYFIKKESLTIEKVQVIGTFSQYKKDDKYTLVKKNNHWEITFHKEDIVPFGGEFLFVINDRYAATPTFNESKNFHMEPFRENELLRSYIIWCLYIIDTEYEVGYKIKGDSIFFVFDPTIYSTINDNQGIKALYDPDVIRKVEVAGSFNEWTEYYTMERQGNIFVKGFKIDENINNWGEFKFIVDDYWVNPPFYAYNKLGHYTGLRHYNFTYKIPGKRNIKGYRIEGDEVVFFVEIKSKDLYTYWERTTADKFTFKNMFLYASFLPQEHQRIKMERISENYYEKRFNISDIPKNKSYQFNFYGNGMIFLTPPYSTTNLAHTDIWDNQQWLNFEITL
ncbi:hypothetical protein NH26_02020 [Flammeovirga pacifica]|uniref:Uncharacterized protein n=2 Tax=Flammeovirga pacifica TaxID=915059 RepID=A0A1S1YW14_FLAPC|nr:hypothetical protein NH26_02020 [Flammeovirga pacifica]